MFKTFCGEICMYFDIGKVEESFAIVRKNLSIDIPSPVISYESARHFQVYLVNFGNYDYYVTHI